MGAYQESFRHYFFIEGNYDGNSGSLHDSYYGLTANIDYTAWNIYLGIGGNL